MTKDELAGFLMTAETAEEYFKRVMEAEERIGSLTREERIVILRSLASELTLGELLEMIAGKRILIVKDKSNEKED